MKNNICNLKNLYRIITEKDYPVYSTGVISQELKKGLTLQKFWQELLIPDFTKQGKYGTMIFRTEGSRNRYFSQFCNRDSSLTFYEAHARELDDILSEDLLKRQAEIFVSFFKKRECNVHELLKKLEAATGAFYEEDKAFDGSVSIIFDTLFLQNGFFLKAGGDTLRNHVAYVYSFFVLFALYGNPIHERDRVERLIGISGEYEGKVKTSLRTEGKSVEIISNKRSILWCAPLDRNRFFGREREMFDLLECIKDRGHCLVSGIGGIGKTELLRQVLHVVEENCMVDEIITVQWENSLQESFAKALPFTPGDSQSDKFSNIIAGFRSREESRRLILIDNVESEIIKDEHLEVINSLKDAIIISSRMTKIKGFETYVIDQLSPESCTLVFRSAYEKKISKNDMELLASLLENRFLRHTLTIGMVGRYMNRHDISIKELETFEERLKTRSLQGVYKKMYAMTDISETEADIMVFLSRMPRIKFDMDFFFRYYPDNYDRAAVIADIERLCNFGWLIYDGECVSVHPFIAECVLSMNTEFGIIERFLRKVIAKWTSGRDIQKDFYEISVGLQKIQNEEDLILSQMVITCLDNGKERISGDFFALYSVALDCILTRTGAGSWNIIYNKTSAIEARAESYEAPVRVSYFCTLYRQTDGMEFKAEVEKLRDSITEEQYCNCNLYMMCIFLEHANYDEGAKRGEYVITHSKDNDTIANAHALLIQMYMGLGKYDEAQQTYEITRSMPCSLRQRNDIEINMATIYSRFGMFKEAEAILESISDTMDKSGQDIKTKWIAAYASVKRSMGKFDEAEELFRNTMNNINYLFGSDSFVYISNKLEYSVVLTKVKKFAEAEKNYIECIDALKRKGYGADIHCRACNNLAVNYIESGKPEKALEWLDQVFDTAKETGGILYAEVLNNHSRALDALGQKEQALAEAKEAYPGLLAVYGPEHIKTKETNARIERLQSDE